MKQIILAVVLILVPVAAFTGFQVLVKNDSASAASLGDLSAFKAIIADVQGLVDKGDMTGAGKRITDYESAWDEAETALRPMNPAWWGNIDYASDAALKAVRATNPSTDKAKQALAALMAVLSNPAQPAN